MELDIPIYGATNSDQLIINWTSKYEPGIYRCGAARPYISIYGVTNLDQLIVNWISKYGAVVLRHHPEIPLLGSL